MYFFKIKILLILAFSLTSVSAIGGKSDARLERLMESYWEKYLENSPMMASYMGYSRYNDQLDSNSDETFSKKARELDKTIAQLKKIPVKKLSDPNRINYEIFKWMLRNERKTLDFDWRYITFNTVIGWQTAFSRLTALTTFNKEDDYRDYLKRLADFGRFADENMALMQKGIETGYVHPCVILSGYEDSISGYISETAEKSRFYKPLTRIPASYGEELIAGLQAEGKNIIDEIIHPAYVLYLNFFEETYKPACRQTLGLSEIPRGRELYDHFVRFYTTVDIDADTVHDLGLSEVTRIRAEMDKIIEEVAFDGEFKDFVEMLRTEPRFYPQDETSYLARAATIAKRVDGKMPEYFSYLPRNPYGIKKVPAAIAAKATAGYYQRGAPDGTRAGVYFLNTYQLKSRPLYELTALTLHEGVPGHHHQISIQAEMDSLPSFRRHYFFHAYSEGWGLYSEFLGEEMGIYDTPYDRFGRLVFEMWRACRLVVDTGIHAKGWGRQQAIDFMTENTALSLHNIASEVDRYISYPGQALSYKLGELKIRELRGKAEKILGKDFSLRDFHTVVLTNGSMPLTVLETTVNRWVSEQQ